MGSTFELTDSELHIDNVARSKTISELFTTDQLYLIVSALNAYSEIKEEQSKEGRTAEIKWRELNEVKTKNSRYLESIFLNAVLHQYNKPISLEK
jgi:hypothetical protein